jgi:hypothetical protein
MENAKTIKELIKIFSPLNDDDYLPVSQPGVYNPITQKNGATRKIKVSQLRRYMLLDLPEKIEEFVGPSANLQEQIDSIKLIIGEIIDSGIQGGGGGNTALPFYALNTPFLIASDKRDLTNGRDYYVYLCYGQGGAADYIKASLSKTAPQGLTADNVKLIGGFHTLCADAGTGMTYVAGDVTKQHPYNGYAAGDILPQSVWCLNHRPYSEPEGMVYIPSLDFWCDIYLPSGSGANTKSEYQGAITRNRQYADFVEDMFCVRKELLSDSEFAAAALGSNEQTTVAGAGEAAATTNGAGGRVDTAGRRMISIHGMEEACGYIWQWLREIGSVGGAGSILINGTTNNWLNVVVATNQGPFAQSGNKGSFYGGAICYLAGGLWHDGAISGSRSRHTSHARSGAGSYISGRGMSCPMRFANM